MGSFIAQRSLQSLISLAGLIIAVFFLARLTGDPANLYLPIDASVEARQEFRDKYGFSDPLIVQFGRFLGDLASAISAHRSARAGRRSSWCWRPCRRRSSSPASPWAGPGARDRHRLARRVPPRRLVRPRRLGALAAGASAPDFWIAISGIILFAVTLHWLPTSGMGPPIYWIMPIGVLLVRPFGLLVQVVRGAMIGALSSAYVKTARAKGVGEERVIFVHALRNSMLAVITVASDQAAGLLNGAVIVETVFGFPGVGKLMIDAIIQRDFALVQAAIIVTAAAIFILNILVDIAYAVLDPRIRHH